MDGITNSMDMMSKLQEMVTGECGVLQSVGLQRVRCNLATEQQPKKGGQAQWALAVSEPVINSMSLDPRPEKPSRSGRETWR